MAYVLTTCGRKGGVSKTTSVMALAGAIQADKETALLVDLDSQASLTKHMLLRHTRQNIDSITGEMTCEAIQAGIATVDQLAIPLDHCPGLSIIPARPQMQLKSQPMPLHKADASIVLIDTPPDTRSGEAQSGLLSADAAYMPCQPTALAMGTLPLTMQCLADAIGRNPRLVGLGILLTAVQPRKMTVQDDCIDQIRRAYGSQLMDNFMPFCVDFQESAALGMTPWQMKKRSKGAKAAAAIWAEIMQRIVTHQEREAA